MCKAEFDKHWPDGKLELQKTNAFLCTYRGERVEVCDHCDIRVSSKDKGAKLPLLVVPGKQATLLGRNWQLNIPLDWGPLKRGIYGTVHNVTEKHQNIFAEV